jgi:GDP-L-fucose synthase
MNKSAKIYVAGHRGLVGSALIRNLVAKGYGNIITRTHAELDLTDQAAVREFFATEKPEYVFLAAAKVGGIFANDTYPAEFIYQNMMIQANIIDAAYRNGVARLMFLGSSCIYPRACPQPIKEEYLLTGSLEATNRPYALAKIAGIEQCWSYNRQYGTKFVAVMPTNLYGPGDNYNLMNSHVIPAMIRKFHLTKLAEQGDIDAIRADEKRYGEIPDDVLTMLGLERTNNAIVSDTSISADRPVAVKLWGTGTPRREFLYSEDMANACVHIMNLSDEEFSPLLGSDESKTGEFLPPVVNIGCGEDVTIRELAEMVRDVVGFRGEITFDSKKPDGTQKKLMDNDRLKRLGWSPDVSLDSGLARAYSDFIRMGE